MHLGVKYHDGFWGHKTQSHSAKHTVIIAFKIFQSRQRHFIILRKEMPDWVNSFTGGESRGNEARWASQIWSGCGKEMVSSPLARHAAGGRHKVEGFVRGNNPGHGFQHIYLSDPHAMACHNMWSREQGRTATLSAVREHISVWNEYLWRIKKAGAYLLTQNASNRCSRTLQCTQWGKASVLINTWGDKNQNTDMTIFV